MARGAGAKEAKAAAAGEKDAKARAAAEAKEAAKWADGAKGKGKGESAAEKAAAAAAKKAERDRLLAEEEASTASKPKPAPAKKAPAKAKPKPAAAAPAPSVPDFDAGVSDVPAEYSASNLDDALDAMSLVNEKTDKASVGAKAAISVDAHPERRFKAAFEAYKEAELPGLRKSHPGLRLQQYNDLMFKDFKTSPLNPFNASTVAYDATKEEKVAALQKEKAAKVSRLRTA